MNKLILFVFVIFISCATSDNHRIVVLEEGVKGYAITCYDERENCEREAEKICNNNYKVHEFVYKQSMNTESVAKTNDEESEEDLTSVFEMTISCQKED